MKKNILALLTLGLIFLCSCDKNSLGESPVTQSDYESAEDLDNQFYELNKIIASSITADLAKALAEAPKDNQNTSQKTDILSMFLPMIKSLSSEDIEKFGKHVEGKLGDLKLELDDDKFRVFIEGVWEEDAATASPPAVITEFLKGTTMSSKIKAQMNAMMFDGHDALVNKLPDSAKGYFWFIGALLGFQAILDAAFDAYIKEFEKQEKKIEESN